MQMEDIVMFIAVSPRSRVERGVDSEVSVTRMPEGRPTPRRSSYDAYKLGLTTAVEELSETGISIVVYKEKYAADFQG